MTGASSYPVSVEALKLADEMQSLGYPEFGDCLSLKAYNLILKALRACTGGVAQRPMDRDEIAKRIAFAHLGDDREWKGFRSHADRFLAYALPSTEGQSHD